MAKNRRFTNLVPLASGISNAKPDYYNSSRPTKVDPRVRTDLSRYIMPSKKLDVPMLPNFFTQVKGPDGKASEIKLQITQDLGCGARGMLEIQPYGQGGHVYNGNAYAHGWTYHSGTGSLLRHIMHPTKPAQPGGAPYYHTTQIRGFTIIDNEDTFREGATWYRNSMELAAEQRAAAIARANEVSNAAYESQTQQTVTIQDEDNADKDNEDSDEKDDDAEYKLNAAAVPNPIFSSFKSKSTVSTGETTSRRSRTACQKSDTSADELTLDRPALKCST